MIRIFARQAIDIEDVAAALSRAVGIRGTGLASFAKIRFVRFLRPSRGSSIGYGPDVGQSRSSRDCPLARLLRPA